jgi:hypothetical protein
MPSNSRIYRVLLFFVVPFFMVVALSPGQTSDKTAQSATRSVSSEWRLLFSKCLAALMNSTSSGFLHFFSTKMHTGMPVEKNRLAGRPITVSMCPLPVTP